MDKQSRFVIKEVKVLAENQTYRNGFIKVEDGKITEVGDMTHYKEGEGMTVYSFPEHYNVIPGLIDLHIHGVKGSDTMDNTAEAIKNIAMHLPKEGTTSFLATTITQAPEQIECALTNVAQYTKSENQEGLAEVLGVHLEGPFISKKRAGAQPAEYIEAPNLEQFKSWQTAADGLIKVVTLAPEEENGLAFVRHLKATNVIASIGHSDATYDIIDQAIDAGVTHVTHLFNGMRGFHHREPGVVGTALARDKLMVEMIVDGIHIHPEAVKAVYKGKTPEKIIIITDSMRAKQLPAGTYELGGQEVFVQEGKALLQDGTLAGSVLKMNEAIKNMMNFTGCTLEETIKMAAENPAKQLNAFDRIGSIKKGKDADLVVLDDAQNVVMTFCKGKLAYTGERG
ncbi:N-acetylglucosamine-6-phosphate deacetylase [Alkalihalobacillus sp. BA299]|uniref:N-acetylglucosamine-6-phosphate deacetylase n=1 Tax=Alkalihalobacillus sp. BA299 TaxID=2815938 RepID=UPI001ADB2043|nr:N-acetylglucosamine-6-phosphate deacetylase [Alkalihalobacillus sp. BA299]